MASITQKLGSTNIYSSTTVVPSAFAVGQMAEGVNGKRFRYGLVGASALVVGNLLQDAAEDTQFENMAVTASPVATGGAAQTLNVTNGTTTVAANQFDGGSVSVYTAGGTLVGEEFTIVSHTTGTSGAALVLTLDRALPVAATTSCKINMKRSPWSGMIQFPATTPTGIPVGVAVFAIPAASYGWVQTHGLASVLSDGSTFAVGSSVGTPSGTAGAVTVYAAATTKATVGVVRQAAAANKGISILLQID